MLLTNLVAQDTPRKAVYIYVCMYTSLCTNEADVRDVTGRSTRAVALNRGYSREEERERGGER
jgi:hypothetical protein